MIVIDKVLLQYQKDIIEYLKDDTIKNKTV